MSNHRITCPSTARDFVLAGNSRFTIVSTKTGARFTFRVRKADGKPAFVAVLTGSCNESDYEFLGTIFDERVYAHGRKSRIASTAPSAVAFTWFVSRLFQGRLPEGVEFWHEGRCGRCARPLTDPISIASGFGPECIKSVLQHDMAA
jgi:hypothetical protein